ncbi:hypothetical protein Hanom_Chr09g00780881 [Helianthus anomalus]
MMYKSFKHQKTSLSGYTLLLKKHGIPLGFHLYSFQTFQNRRFLAPLSLWRFQIWIWGLSPRRVSAYFVSDQT